MMIKKGGVYVTRRAHHSAQVPRHGRCFFGMKIHINNRMLCLICFDGGGAR